MNGILLIDKPAGWTSMDVCAKLRGALKEKRIGHSGTLDPMATGVLVVFLGRATRAVEFAEADEKTYLASLRLGLSTDTQDVTGTVLETCPAEVTDAQLDSVLMRFRGEIDQLPPMYSALKVNGQKLYQLARKGREVARKPRRITVFELERTGREGNGDILLRVRCSKGTYIRTLCNDIGADLGCGGTMSALRRIRSGAFEISGAHMLEEVLMAAAEGTAEQFLLPVDTLFTGKEKLTLSPAQEKALRNGVRWTCPLPEQEYLLYGASGEFLALAAVSDGKMKAIKTFFEVEAQEVENER